MAGKGYYLYSNQNSPNGADTVLKEQQSSACGSILQMTFSCHAWVQREPVFISSDFVKGMAERLALDEPS